MEVLRFEIDAIGGRRALQQVALEAPLMIEVENREASDRQFFRVKRHGRARKWCLPAGVTVHRTDSRATAMKIEDATKDAPDLYWLAFLLTGRRDISLDIPDDTGGSQDDGNPFFAAWMHAWSRRVVIAKALAAIRDELGESTRRTELARLHQSAAPPRDWSLSPDSTKTQIEEALLAIDVFPRAAVLLLIFEGVRIADAAKLLDSDATLVRKGQTIGLREFTTKLATKKDHAVPGFSPALAVVASVVRETKHCLTSLFGRKAWPKPDAMLPVLRSFQ